MTLTVVSASVALVAGTLGSVLFVLSLHRSLESGLVSTAKQDSASIIAQLADGASPEQVVITGADDVVVQLVGPDGRVVASDQPAAMEQPLLSGPGTATDKRVPGEDDLFTVFARSVAGNDEVAMVVVGRSTEQTDRARTATAVLLLFAVPLGVAVLAVIVWISVGRALRPVEAMRREADMITSAHLHRRLATPPGDDEIARLAVTLNEMLDRIDQSHRLQRQFVSDASHELRSPLAAIRQSAEVARSYPARVSMDSLTDDVLFESRRLQSLVDALLLLAQLDDAGGPPGHDLVDLDDLILVEVERIRGSLSGATIDISQVSGGQVHGSSILLGQAVRNLIENAVRHARSLVSVSLSEHEGSVWMCVDDDGLGVPADEWERVFERFVRLDEARDREAGGAGLGLAIVRKIVEVSGGTVQLSSGFLGGARLSVHLPAAN